MFSKYKKSAMPVPFGPPNDPQEKAEIKRLTDRLGYHMQRVIVAARLAEGWIAAYSTMSSTHWPRVFPKPLSFADMVQSLDLMIEAYEPKAPNREEDAQVRALADRLVNSDPEYNYVFVAYRENGYEITMVRYGSLVDEWPAQGFEDAMLDLMAWMPVPHEPVVDNTDVGVSSLVWNMVAKA